MSILTPQGRGLGYVRDPHDPRDFIYDAVSEPVDGFAAATGGSLPTELPPIWNQLPIGACTAHGTIRGLVALLMRLGITLPTPPPPVNGDQQAPFSRLEQYFNSRALEGNTLLDSGAAIRDALKAIATLGVAAETAWPYDVTKFATKPGPDVLSAIAGQVLAYHRLIVGTPGAPIRTALLSKKVVVFGFDVPASFEDGSWDPASGEPLPLPGPNAQFIGRHCVAATYYNFSSVMVSGPYYTGRRGNFFSCDNSWGSNWGMGGRFNIDSEYFNPSRGLVSDAWVIDAAK